MISLNNLHKKITIHHYSKIFVVMLSLLPLIPLWHFEYLPFQDYPNHFARLEIKANYGNSDFLRENFQLIPLKAMLLPTYVTLDIFVNRLMSFLDTDSAMRVFISLYVILYITAIYLLSRQLRRDFSLLLLFNLPFIYSAFFYQGFLNFLMSIPLFLFTIMFVERCKTDPSKTNIFWVLFFILMLYLTHIFTFSLLCIFLLISLFTFNMKMSKRIYLFAFFSLLLIASLSIIDIKIKSWEEPLSLKLMFLTAPFSQLPVKLLLITSAIFIAAICIMAIDSSSYKRQYLYVSFAFFLIYLILPFKIMASFADARALLFSLILFTLSINLRGRWAGILRLLMTILFIINLSWLWVFCFDFNKNFSTRCAALMESKSIVLPVTAINSESFAIRPYLHSWGYFLRHKEILTPYLVTGSVLQIEYKNKPPAPSAYWAIRDRIEEGLGMTDTIRLTYDYILFMGRNEGVENTIESFTDKVCSEGIVSLYKIKRLEMKEPALL